MQNLTSQEMEDSDLSVQYQHIREDISCILTEGGTTDGMLRAEQELNLKLNKVMFRMTLQSEDTVTGLTVLMLAAIALLYIAATVSLLIFSLLALIRLLKKGDTSAPSRAYLFALTAIPCLLCLILFLVFASFDTVASANSVTAYTFFEYIRNSSGNLAGNDLPFYNSLMLGYYAPVTVDYLFYKIRLDKVSAVCNRRDRAQLIYNRNLEALSE